MTAEEYAKLIQIQTLVNELISGIPSTPVIPNNQEPPFDPATLTMTPVPIYSTEYVDFRPAAGYGYLAEAYWWAIQQVAKLSIGCGKITITQACPEAGDYWPDSFAHTPTGRRFDMSYFTKGRGEMFDESGNVTDDFDGPANLAFFLKLREVVKSIDKEKRYHDPLIVAVDVRLKEAMGGGYEFISGDTPEKYNHHQHADLQWRE